MHSQALAPTDKQQTIGLIGGMSWESTVSYYTQMNRAICAELGGLHSAQLLLSSVDFEQVAAMQRADDWHAASALLCHHAAILEHAGAQAIVLCTNTMHKVAADIEARISIPLLHIADSLGDALNNDGRRRIGLLGTRFTMQQPFYRERLADHGIEMLTPDAQDQDDVHDIIFNELCAGKILPASRQRYLEIATTLTAQGAEAIVLGCTEIGLLLNASHTDIPLYDTTVLHADAAVRFALAK